MDELSISVNIADRTYKLKIKKEEEENIRKATNLINLKLKDYADNFAFKDKQDLLAMVSLQFTTSSLFYEKQKSFHDGQIVEKLSEIDKVLSEHLDKD